MGVIGVLAKRGSTSAFHGPWNGLSSTRRDSRQGNVHSQGGRECILFLRILRVWSFWSSARGPGIVEIPVESAIKTRKDVNSHRNSGRARRGLDEIFSSSKEVHVAKAGDNKARKFADISSAKSVEHICGSEELRKAGT